LEFSAEFSRKKEDSPRDLVTLHISKIRLDKNRLISLHRSAYPNLGISAFLAFRQMNNLRVLNP